MFWGEKIGKNKIYDEMGWDSNNVLGRKNWENKMYNEMGGEDEIYIRCNIILWWSFRGLSGVFNLSFEETQ